MKKECYIKEIMTIILVLYIADADVTKKFRYTKKERIKEQKCFVLLESLQSRSSARQNFRRKRRERILSCIAER